MQACLGFSIGSHDGILQLYAKTTVFWSGLRVRRVPQHRRIFLLHKETLRPSAGMIVYGLLALV
jgi:hypothetical protein